MDNNKVIVSDEELKEVTGGLNKNINVNTTCASIKTKEECEAIKGCQWSNAACAGNSVF